MTKEEVFNAFYTNSSDFNLKTVLIIMMSAMALGLVIWLVYFLSHLHGVYHLEFGMTLVGVLLISTVVMLMISSNIVISLGMVGALSIVRFRTAVKSSRDTVFIFWSITEGLCIGSQNFQLAMLTTVVIGLFFVCISWVRDLRSNYIIVIQGNNEEIDEKSLIEAVKNITTAYKVHTINKSENHQEVVISVRKKKSITLEEVEQIKSVKGVDSVNWVAQSGETAG